MTRLLMHAPIVLTLLLSVAAIAASEQTPATEAPRSAVTLVTGEVIRGTIVESNIDEIVLQHSLLGRLVIARTGIESIVLIEEAQLVAPSSDEALDPPSTADPTEPTEPTEPTSTPPPPPPEKVAGPPPKPGWAAARVDLLEVDESLPAPGTVEWLANVQASISGVNSDTNQFDLRVAAAVARLSHTDKFSAAAEYYYSLLNGDSTDNNLLATSVYDYYLLPSDWLAFGKGQYQYDAFQDWENRLSAYAGLGYRVFHTRPFALTVKAGFGATHEFGNINRTTPEAYGEVAFAWWIDERQSIEGSVYMAPDVTDFGQYRVLARLDWTFRLDSNGLALVGGLREEYQSRVGSGSTRNDFRYYAGFRLDF